MFSSKGHPRNVGPATAVFCPATAVFCPATAVFCQATVGVGRDAGRLGPSREVGWLDAGSLPSCGMPARVARVRSRLWPGSERGGRGVGFTLLELLLVLGILVVLAGITMPMALDTLDTHRLRASADRIQGAFADARNQAIRSGNEVAFYYQTGFRTFFVMEFNPLIPKPLPLVPDEAMARDSTSDVRSNILEMGVRFAGANVSPDSRSQVSQVTDVPNYQRILFYPDGTAQPARVFLINETGSGLRIELRSLTGTSVVSEILLAEDFQ